jgi:penicillin-binding protein 1A
MDGQLGAPDRSAAIVTIDPATGYIKAMASSSRYGDSKFNLAAQGHRQPGSTFKVMVLMTALRNGVDPNSTSYTSKPLPPGWLPTAPTYGVKTYDDTYKGRIDLVQATLRSDNSVYAQLDADLGPDAVRQTAYDLGIKTRLNAYPAEGLGGLTQGVSPLEMADAYATIASGGWRNRPIAITKVTFPDGHVDDLGKPRRHKAFDDGVTYEATKILKENILRGTGYPNATAIGCPAAGKTGTTDKNSDAWFVGFTPKLATAVWLGHANSRAEMPGITGGTIPATIWGQYMKVARGSYCGDFPQPKVPFVSAPFFGNYATGSSNTPNSTYPPTTTGPGNGANQTGGTQSGGTQDNGTGGGGKYPPQFYQSPPQPPPATTPGQGGTPAGQTGGAVPTGR